MGSHRYFVAALVTLLAGAGSAAFGTTTVVLPGPGTPLQDAIDAAAPGDTLRIQDAFEENIVIDKPLRIMPSRRGILQGAAISATCGSAASTIDVQADRVTIRDITVSGGTHAAINVVGRNDVRISHAHRAG
jgi:nitrous oxidase accessory protein NosD